MDKAFKKRLIRETFTVLSVVVLTFVAMLASVFAITLIGAHVAEWLSTMRQGALVFAVLFLTVLTCMFAIMAFAIKITAHLENNYPAISDWFASLEKRYFKPVPPIRH